MAVQSLVGFRVNPGGRDALLAVLAQAKANTEAAGAAVRVANLTAGTNAGAIVVATTYSSWEAFADYSDAIAGNLPTQPVRDLLQSTDPPAVLLGTFVRSELLARDGDDAGSLSFSSSLSFDVSANRAAVVAAAGGTRDAFESLGASNARVWTVANGENAGRITISGEYNGVGGWARFRAALDAHTAAGNPLPMAAVAADTVSAGIAQSAVIDL